MCEEREERKREKGRERGEEGKKRKGGGGRAKRLKGGLRKWGESMGGSDPRHCPECTRWRRGKG